MVFLPDDARLGSEDPTGELLWPLEILRAAPGLASVVRERWGSDSLSTNASRLLETAARLDDPLGLPKMLLLMNAVSLEIVESLTTGLLCLE